MTHVHPLHLSLCPSSCPSVAPRSPPLAPPAPDVHPQCAPVHPPCPPQRASGVKAAAVKVKTHLVPSPFVQGCHYAGCDQATKFSSKINRPPPAPRPASPGSCTPRRERLLAFIAPHLWQRTCSLFIPFSIPPLFCILLLFWSIPPVALLFLITLTHL